MSSPPFFSDNHRYFMTEICVEKANELSKHQMIWTDEDGFLLKPLGTIILIHIRNAADK